MEVKVNKKHKIIIMVIFIIAIILMISGIVLLLYTPNNKVVPKEVAEKNKKITEYTVEDNTETVKIKKSDKEATDFIPNYICGGVALNLNQKNKDVSELSSIDKLNMILSIYSKEIISSNDTIISIPEDDLKKYFKDLSFLKDFKPSVDTCTNNEHACHKDAIINQKIFLPVYIEFKNKQLLIKMYGTGCTGPRYTNYYMKLIDTETNNNEQVLTYLYYYSETEYYVEEGRCNYRILRAQGDRNIIDTVECSQIDNYNFDITKFDKYKFIFDTTDNNLRLTSINYVK